MYDFNEREKEQKNKCDSETNDLVSLKQLIFL